MEKVLGVIRDAVDFTASVKTNNSTLVGKSSVSIEIDIKQK